MKPTIYINGRFLTQRPTGIQNFALGIAHELHEMGCTIVFLTPSSKFSHPGFGEIVQIGRLNGHLWEQTELPFYVLRQKIKTLVNLGNSAPAWLNNNFVTVHDLAFLRPEKWFSLSYRFFYGTLTPIILKRAKEIFTVSETSKKEICSEYQISKNRIGVLKNGIYLPQQSKPEPIQVPEKYFLFVGSLDPRKRVTFLIDAFKNITDPSIKLLIVGGSNPIFKQEKISENPNIKFLDHVSNLQLQYLYKNAMALVLPSLYEGFGRPILEALYNETEVICSDIAVFRENFDGLVHFFNTKDSNQLTKKLNELSTNCNIYLSKTCPPSLFSYRFAASLVVSKHQ